MALGPRLDLRQSQTLVMTPQLRQAIQLLQYSNVEVTSFIEQELERNPLLERDETSESPIGERAALDQITLRGDAPSDSSDAARAERLPSEAASPLDSVHAEDYDAGGPADGGPSMS
jgi:RNA polymerase sigma-54 factor